MNKKLPSSWKLVQLGDICSKPQYGWTTKAVDKGQIKYLRTTDISSHNVDFYKIPYCLEVPEDLEKFQLSKNDILISRSGSVGISYRINTQIDFPIIFASYLIRFRTYEEVTAEYLQFFFESGEYWEQINDFTTGIAIPNINASKLEQIKVPLPPLDEQKLIVDKIKLLKVKSTRIKNRLSDNHNQLFKWRKSLLASAANGELTRKWRIDNPAFSTTKDLTIKNASQFKADASLRPLSAIPNSWKWTALGNYADLSRGRFSVRPRNDPKFFNGKYPFIQIGDLPKEGGMIFSHSQTLNAKGTQVSKLFKKDTVVIAIVGSTIGNTGVLAYDMYFTDSLVGITTDIVYSNYFIEFYLRSEKENVRAASYSGGGQPNIKLQILNNYPLPLPPLEEQQAIVQKVNEALLSINSLEAKYKKLKQYVDQVNINILQQAFSGKLISQLTDVEPVSILLKRFAEMKKQPIKKSKKEMVPGIDAVKEKDLLSFIKHKFKGSPFSFDILQSQSSLSYEDLSFELLKLVSIDNQTGRLNMSFDKKQNCILFNLNKA